MKIYITGIDGAGKSTIIERVKSDIFPVEKVNVIWARYEPRIMKILTQPFKKSKTQNSTNFNDMNEVQYNNWSSYKATLTKNKFLSCFIFLVQYMEYSIKVKKVLVSINQSDEITIVDRFILDFIVDQSVNHKLDGQNWIVKRLLKKLNVFDKIIFIDVDEDVAFNRKADIPSLSYLTERRNYYKKYITMLNNGYIVTNNTTIDSAILKIKEIIL